MKIEELLKPPPILYQATNPPENGWPQRRSSPDALLASLNKAHDNLRVLSKENGILRASLQKFYWWLKFAVWIASGIVVVTWAVLGYLAPYAVKGMAK